MLPIRCKMTDMTIDDQAQLLLSLRWAKEALKEASDAAYYLKIPYCKEMIRLAMEEINTCEKLTNQELLRRQANDRQRD